LKAIKQEGLDYMGIHPCVFTEIGIPYDMNNQAAYKTGDYSSQIRAMDANHFALEGSKSCYTLWNYTSTVLQTLVAHSHTCKLTINEEQPLLGRPVERRRSFDLFAG